MGCYVSRLVNSYRHTEGKWCLDYQSSTSWSSNSWIADRDDGATRAFGKVLTVYQSSPYDIPEGLEIPTNVVLAGTHQWVPDTYNDESTLPPLSSWRPGCDPKPVHVGFMEDKLGPGQIFFRILQF